MSTIDKFFEPRGRGRPRKAASNKANSSMTLAEAALQPKPAITSRHKRAGEGGEGSEDGTPQFFQGQFSAEGGTGTSNQVLGGEGRPFVAC